MARHHAASRPHECARLPTRLCACLRFHMIPSFGATGSIFNNTLTLLFSFSQDLFCDLWCCLSDANTFQRNYFIFLFLAGPILRPLALPE